MVTRDKGTFWCSQNNDIIEAFIMYKPIYVLFFYQFAPPKRRMDMKNILMAFALTMVSFGLNAQITWDHQKPDTVFRPETDLDVEVHNNVTFQDSGVYRWVRSVITTCPITSAICDKNTCYLETVDSANFEVTANESFPVLCHFYPDNNCCKHAKVLLKIYKISDPKITSTAEYNISLWCTQLSVTDASSSKLEVYPNPVQDFLNINLQPANKAKLDVYNELGVLVISKVIESTELVDLTELNKGIYTVVTSTTEGTFRKRIVKI
ncbi:MAG: T9SS type A sorting domain-containing protein [Bacteroidetes bacterium]|nr:T9SS type A sorting domain-containing protein [Bacteroidota bacterium]